MLTWDPIEDINAFIGVDYEEIDCIVTINAPHDQNQECHDLLKVTDYYSLLWV